MKKLIYALTLLIGLNGYSYEVSEETAIAKLEEFFYLLDVERYDREDFSKVVTEDFQIFEDGLDLDLDSFHQFVTEATSTIVETEWTLTDFKVTLNTDSSHISYYNYGLFKTDKNEVIKSLWMESVYLIIEDGELKVQFLQSDLKHREIK